MTVTTATLLAALLALPACSGSDDEAGMPSGDLANREFVSTSVTEGGKARPLVPDTEITISFERQDGGESLSWDAGCNSAGGDVEITEDQLVINGDRIVTTLIGCPRTREAQDTWLWKFFDADPKLDLTETELTLTSGDTEIAFAPRP